MLGSTTGRVFPGEAICEDGIVSDGVGSDGIGSDDGRGSSGDRIGSSCWGRLGLPLKRGVAAESVVGVGELRRLGGLFANCGLVFVATDGEFETLLTPSMGGTADDLATGVEDLRELEEVSVNVVLDLVVGVEEPEELEDVSVDSALADIVDVGEPGEL